MARLENLDFDTMSPDQKKAAEGIMGSRGHIVGPFIPWLRNPELADRGQKLGAYCRFETSLPPRLSELAILMIAREWTAQVEWFAHKPIALKAGTDPDLIDAIEGHRAPAFKNKDEEVVYKFATELLQNKAISDATYVLAIEEFGEATVIDLVAVLGYYNLVAMTLKTFEILPADGSTPLAE